MSQVGRRGVAAPLCPYKSIPSFTFLVQCKLGSSHLSQDRGHRLPVDSTPSGALLVSSSLTQKAEEPSPTGLRGLR
jgi:hypothetical protein